MSFDYEKCPVCKSSAYLQQNYQLSSVFCVCPVCGRFEISVDDHTILSPRLASYLYYHRFIKTDTEYRYHTTLPKDQCDQYRKDFEVGNNIRGRPVHMDASLVDSWYPKTFSEKVDLIVLQLSYLTKHIGQWLEIDRYELFSLLFVDRIEKKDFSGKTDYRNDDDCIQEVSFMLDYLQEESVIQCEAPHVFVGATKRLRLTPKGYSRVDILQKNISSGRNALVAMEFGDDTRQLREAIRQGIEPLYHAVFIDEVQHNDFITPELLKYIRDSKFVVVDLTHQNNGAYFEEGYAMGLGKPVIQLCKDGTKLHFDIAQKNTIIWKSEDEIPKRLENRIRATIE